MVMLIFVYTECFFALLNDIMLSVFFATLNVVTLSVVYAECCVIAMVNVVKLNVVAPKNPSRASMVFTKNS